jgi:hypothetical protein
MLLCLVAAAPPIWRRSLTPIESASRPFPSRASAGGALAPPVTCAARPAEPRPVLVPGGGGARAPLMLVRPPGRAKPAGGGARVSPLAASSDPGGWSRLVPAFLSPTLHMYISIVSDNLDVYCNWSTLMLQK